MSVTEEPVFLESENESESEVENQSSESESESSESESEEELPPPPPVKRGKGSRSVKGITRSTLGEIERSDSPPPPPRRKYQPRKPLSEEAKEARRQALVKARAARSAYAAQRRVEELQKQIGRYDIKEEESSSSDEEIVLTRKTKQKVLPTKKQEALDSGVKIEARKKKEKKEEKIPVDGPRTLEKKKTAKEQEKRLKMLEQMVLDGALSKKKKKSKQTIININTSDPPSKSEKSDMKKMLLDLGI